MLLDQTDAAEADAIGARLLGAVARHPLVDAHTVTISVGTAEFASGENVNDWLRRADRALYRAKAAGRNTHVVG